ncbi:hypothetical protein GCM10025859_51850 [Alicyclobacillus fastidiosus]|nr:hypothetical protein GCM10025859_51850 [Alicyclobacillus fastidiosus]
MMDYTVRKISTKIFTGSPIDVEEEVNEFLGSIDTLNYVDLKVATSDVGTLSVVVVYRNVRHVRSV